MVSTLRMEICMDFATVQKLELATVSTHVQRLWPPVRLRSSATPRKGWQVVTSYHDGHSIEVSSIELQQMHLQPVPADAWDLPRQTSLIMHHAG